jgi:hypothetical protein
MGIKFVLFPIPTKFLPPVIQTLLLIVERFLSNAGVLGIVNVE